MADEGTAADRSAGLDTSEVVMYAAGTLLLVASFLPMLAIDLAAPEDDFGFGELFGAFIDTEWTAWSNAFSIFPLVSFPVLCVLVVVGAKALERFASTTMPERLFGFPLPVARAAAAAFASVAVGAQLVRALVDSGGEGDDGSLVVGSGGWLAAVALVALLLTTVQEAMSSPTNGAERRRPDTRATGITLAGAVAVLVASFLEVWSAPDGRSACGLTGASIAPAERSPGSSPLPLTPALQQTPSSCARTIAAARSRR